MKESIRSIFEDECSELKIDKKLVKRIGQYEREWANRDEDSIAFLGGNLLGVYPIRFKESDRNYWFDDILEVDDVSLKQRIHSLPDVNTSWAVSSDIMNLSCMWLLHAIYSSKDLSNKDKEAGMINVLLVLHYKFLSSLMSHYFKYPADKQLAMATYAALSKKFALKRHGSWAALLRSRSDDIISKKSVWYETYTDFTDDLMVTKMIADIQGRIREVVKKMNAVFYQLKDDGTRIQTSSMTGVDMEGEVSVREQIRSKSSYIRYAKDIMGDKRSFLKQDLVEVISSAMHTMPERLLTETLSYMSDNYMVRGEKHIDKLIDTTLIHAFDFIGDDSNFARNMNLGDLISKLKAVYMASRSSDPYILEMRDKAEKIVSKAVKIKNSSVISSVRTGLLMYIVLRTLTMKHYNA